MTTSPRLAFLDYETFSEADLPKVGHYRYAEDPSTEILLCAYQRDEWPEPRIWSPAEGEPLPDDLADILDDSGTLIVAFNAPFERAITRNCLPEYDVPIERWRCAMVDAMAVGFPAKLETVGPAVGLDPALFKQEGGRRLITRFCKPRKPTKKNPDTRWTPRTAPEQWAQFKAYCVQDVVAETAVWNKLKTWRLPPVEQKLWEMDQAINDRGIQVDMELVRAAHAMGIKHRERLIEKAKALTGLDNPNSVKQLVEWLNTQPDFDPEQENDEVDNLRKKTVEEILGRGDLTDTVREMLELRQQIAKSSLKKYETLLRATCFDGRIRGTMQFYGANRTGRWAGRLLQVQNLPQGMIEDLPSLSIARYLVRVGDYEAIAFMFGEDQVSNVLATLIRTCLIAAPGHRLIVADLSAIEARVIAWFAKCEWRLQVFRTHGKIYEASASTAFKIPFEDFIRYKKETGKHHPARKKGKVMELALGYQGAANALITMGALEMGVTVPELEPMVAAWRTANPEIAGKINDDGWPEGGLWRDVEQAAKRCIRSGRRQEAAGCIFRFAGGMMVITLPSGRHLHYVRAHLTKDGKREQIAYWGVDQKTKRWGLLYTYGGKLVENIVQALSRDILREILFRLPGYHPVMLVHDEAVFEELEDQGSLDDVLVAFATDVDYTPGLPLKGAGFENPYYYKD
jgi:DNA polymerase